MMANRTVGQVVEKKLCTGCGTCVSMCPKKAVSLFIEKKSPVYVAKVDNAVCVNCGLCLKVCPGYAVDFAQLNRKFLGKDLPADRLGILLGNYLKCYNGFASDAHVRYDSSSGGLVTQLLLFALDEGIIDGVLVTRMSKDNPLESEPFIARTKKEIIEASKSKYCPVPANIALREILEKDGKYAVVGLPCHIQGIRKAEFVNKTLRARIVLHLGIFCSHTDNFYQTDYLLKRWNIKRSDVHRIDFRGKGWPGLSSIRLKSGNELNYPYLDWTAIHELYFFSPPRCFVCYDHTSELADVSFGDAWLPEFSNDKIGQSVVISRTMAGEMLLLKAKASKKVKLNEVSALKVAVSQGMVRFKKPGFFSRSIIFRLIGKEIPTYSVPKQKTSFLDLSYSSLLLFNNALGTSRRNWWLIPSITKIQKTLKESHKAL